MMEVVTPRLLVREEQELDVIADAIRGGRRIVAFLVCPWHLRAAVVSYLSERGAREVPLPTWAGSAERMLSLLSDAAHAETGEVRCVGLNPDIEPSVQVLNWHREKLRRGASMLIWIPDLAGLRVVRRLAPDAFSFRDTLVAIEGERSLGVIPADLEHADVRLARARYEAARSHHDRLQATVALAAELAARGGVAESLELADRALAAAEEREPMREEETTLMAALQLTSALALTRDGRGAAAWKRIQHGLIMLRDLSSLDARSLRFRLVSAAPSPLGKPHRMLRDAAGAHNASLLEDGDWILFTGLSQSLTERGAARESSLMQGLMTLRPPGRLPDSSGVLLQLRSLLALRRGRLGEVESELRRAQSLAVTKVTGNDHLLQLLAEVLALMGEIAPARELLAELSQPREPTNAFASGKAACHLDALLVDSGEVEDGLAGLQSLSQYGIATGRDQIIYRASSTLTACVLAANDAGRLGRAEIESAVVALQESQSAAIALSGDDPPWYQALYPVLRGQILFVSPEGRIEAIESTRSALALCEGAYSDAAPMTARTLATHLVNAGRFEEAMSVIERAIPKLREELFLEDLARAQALTLVCLAVRSASRSELAIASSSLRATFNQMGAPRITADVLLDLALLLPPELHHPDPFSLLEEAHDLFSEMRIVAKEARCFEAIGDVLSARGDLLGARGRHQTAKEILERSGLLLRVPLLEKKLAGAPS